MSYREAMRYRDYAKTVENLIKRVDDPSAVREAFRGARMRTNTFGRELQAAIDDLKDLAGIELEVRSEPMDNETARMVHEW